MMGRAVLALAMVALLLGGLVSCHLQESKDDILVLTLDNSLAAYATVEVVVLDITGTQEFSQVWDAPLPNPPTFRVKLEKQDNHAFTVRVRAKDADGTVKLVKVLTWKDGRQTGTYVINGAKAEYSIKGLRVVEEEDRDKDSFARFYKTVLDVDGNTSGDTLQAKFYARESGGEWVNFADRPVGVKGAVPTDTIFVASNTKVHRVVDIKAEVYAKAGDKDSLVGSAEVKGIKEETSAQDAPDLKWSLRNHTGAVLLLSGTVGGNTFSNQKVQRGEAYEVNLPAKAATEKIAWRAVADMPGEPVVFRDSADMEMDAGVIADTAKPDADYFALNLKNISNRKVTGILIVQGSDTARYATDLPHLDEFRNMGLYPYKASTRLGLEYDGKEQVFNGDLTFGTHTVQRYRFADFTFSP